MRRQLARWMPWWVRLFLVSLIIARFTDLPALLELVVPFALLGLALIRPRAKERPPEVVAAPVRGRWTALNSPGTKVPSHSIRAYGQTFAIDVLHPRGPGRVKVGWGLGMRRPEEFSSFGEPVLAVADGVVVRTADGQRDHRSRESWPSIIYLMILEGTVRELGGPRFVLGNHIVVDHGNGVFAAYAHLQQRSVRVAEGDRVTTGQHLADVGNSGNTTEPHLHVQLMDRPVVTEAAGVPFRWQDVEILRDEVDSTRSRKPVKDTIEPGLPADGQIFVTDGP